MILQWQPTSKVFQKEESSVLLILKSLMEKSKTLLVTREYFEKKWFINSCNFIKYVNHPVVLNRKINIPIVIVSSGPSLRDALPVIKMYRNRIFVLCLSSAIKVCISNDIIPDLCMSTDGGFWAGEHLKSLYLNDIPLALALEGFCPKALLGSHKILPLVYNDNISHEIALKTKLPFMHGERNGTVSGTALVFALENSTGSVYICGMDMSNQRGYQHCQPNEIELDNSVKDYKLKSREQRISQSEYSKGVLSIYREWFDSFELKNRKVYRIINKEYKKNKLGYIKDINTYDFKNELSLINKDSGKNDYFNEARYRKDLLSLKEYLRILMESDQWKKNIFPLSMTSLRHNPDNADIVNRLEKEQSNLFRKIENIF